MSEEMIKVRNLSKQYRLGTVGTGTLSHDLNRVWARLRGKEDPYLTVGELNDRTINTNGGYVWALRDVSFDLKQGEVLGIVGKNGAGKSTLLKLLSRITKPSEGIIKLKGRVGSLLEVGTGFHPELTGRENVFLNGAILGMSKCEVSQKLESIIDFSGVRKYLDTPVKRYSSGMKVRLGFSVAVHLEPEVLIVDEVLAVGDVEFQKKCIEKMSFLSKERGKTILFVSHNLQAIRKLCPRSILLDKGRVISEGPTNQILSEYLMEQHQTMHMDKQKLISSFPSDADFRLEDVKLIQDNYEDPEVVKNGDPLRIEAQYQVINKIVGFRLYFDLIDKDGELVLRSYSDGESSTPSTALPGFFKSLVIIPRDFLAPGHYRIRFYSTVFNHRSLTPGGVEFPFRVERTGIINQGYPSDPIVGKIAPIFEWRTSGSHND